MDRELLAHFLQTRQQEVAARDRQPLLSPGRPEHCAGPLMTRLVEAGVTSRSYLKRYRHAELGVLGLYRQLLLDPLDQQLLLVFTAVPGSASDAKLRGLTAAGGWVS